MSHYKKIFRKTLTLYLLLINISVVFENLVTSVAFQNSPGIKNIYFFIQGEFAGDINISRDTDFENIYQWGYQNLSFIS